MRIFAGFLDIEGADRLTPFKTEMPKSRENTRFWAGSDYTRHPKVYSLYRKDFSVNKDVISAALSVTARGVYEATLNGQRVGNFIMAPGRHIF